MRPCDNFEIKFPAKIKDEIKETKKYKIAEQLDSRNIVKVLS